MWKKQKKKLTNSNMERICCRQMSHFAELPEVFSAPDWPCFTTGWFIVKPQTADHKIEGYMHG